MSQNFNKLQLMKKLTLIARPNTALITSYIKFDSILKMEEHKINSKKKPNIDVINPKANRVLEVSKKIIVNSIFYYEWSRDSLKNVIPYYYISTPLTKFNEINIPVQENPYTLCKSMTIEEFFQIGKFDYDSSMQHCKVFVYDQFTAIPYRVQDFTASNRRIGRRRDSLVRHLIKTESNTINNEKMNRKRLDSSNGHKSNILVIVLNDFFDSFNKYFDTMIDSLVPIGTLVDNLKLICFNFPGQAITIFPKKTTFNNLYFSEFLDRFLFNLVENNVFDHTYSVILVGFGNGGHVALTFASCYEKYWDFIHSIILFNCYSENDDFISKSMLEILKIVESSKNPKLVDFFYKSITVNPQKLLDLDINSNIEKSIIEEQDKFEEQNSPNLMTMNGYYNITKGFFFNIRINHGDIKTPLIVVHSNQNCFITINNINTLFKNMKNNNPNNNSQLNIAKRVSNQYNFDELSQTNNVRRKFVVVDGSHDIIIEDSNYVSSVISSYLRYILKNNQIVPKIY